MYDWKKRMIRQDVTFYLASKSPRRKKLLEQINIHPHILDCEIDEQIDGNPRPSAVVQKLAVEKMEEGIKHKKSGVIITADTIVVLGKKILGKPNTKKEAVAMLQRLSGNKHYVYTGFCVFNSINSKKIVSYEKTEVTFRDLTNKEIEEYVNGGSPMDKAGAYGIQDDYGAIFIKKINGCYYNVVGLPLTKVYQAIQEVLSC